MHQKQLLGDFAGSSFVGFDGRHRKVSDSVIAVIGNLGFLYNLRTGVLHVRIVSSLTERKQCVRS